jgi:hypothetical protein
VVGKFIDRQRPTFLDAMNQRFSAVFGSRYVPYGIATKVSSTEESNA